MSDAAFEFTGLVRPVCQVGLSDVREPEPDSWLDVSCYVHEAELFRGRDRFTDRFQPGTATVTFDNRNGWGDLVGSPSVVAGQTLRPGRPIRVGVAGSWTGGSATRWLWRGWIDQTTPRYDPVEHDVVVVNCVDSLGEAGSTPAPASYYQGVNEGAGTRIGRVLDAVEWFTVKRKIDTSFAVVQGTSLGALGIDLMGQAADSAGGVVHGDTDGDVVFRDINWMLYDPDDPPDGTIGNVDPGVPGIPYVPGYLDPTLGYVYWPAPPPVTGPTTFTACADDGGGSGTLVEQGDAYEMFVEGGRLRFRSGGRVWDAGEFDGGCVGVTFDPDTGGGIVTRIDDPDHDGVWDISPFPAVEIPPVDLPPLVELLAYRDFGFSEPPQASTTPGPIEPGVDCWLICLLNTIGSDTNTGPLAASCSGGGAAWTPVEWADSGTGASAFVWVTQIGRVDPGLFSLSISWSGTTVAYAVTVWRCWLVSEHYRANVDAATILRAATVSDPDIPEEVEPGDGPHTISLVDGTGTVGTTTVDQSIIAQSLAYEDTPPYGAVFADEDPPWIIPALPGGLEPVVLVAAGEWSDDFERPGPDVGEDWTLGPYATVAGPLSETLSMFTIDTGAAVGPSNDGTEPQPAASMIRATAPAAGDQSIEIEVDNFWGPDSYAWFELYNFVNPEPIESTNVAPRRVASIFWDGVELTLSAYSWTLDGSSSGGVVVSDYAVPTGVFTFRLDSYGDGRQVVTFNGAVVIDYVESETVGVGTHQGFYGSWFAWEGVTAPRVLSINGAATPPLKASWVAGWRTGAATDEVTWSDVNLGPSNVYSTQAAVVVETLAPGPYVESTGPLVIGGELNPYNRYIYEAAAIPGLDPNAPVDPIWIFNPGDL